MRVTSFILIFIGLIGILNPELFIAEGSGGGRWVFVVIFLLGVIKMWPTIKAFKRNDDDY
ncbi:hypothetical protein [Bartonella doshiae]|uniref:Uncharacterized protein n=2 Tax=Bartonella doshiae TaxID=33044 RepID=A0A380ZDU9_BARDO|nr:hypothetical protein [Bartonella doshiae]EJF81893.1 hypothetical protein MCS_00318 [Bartonella doshiae NCTC 12862 = ATCC 700133]MBB6159395.1 uncharacterized membrane protein YobD (UPF0266 family) [Bartonella doshiae]SUV44680.1 Uncharacterised protein [Bartonella doshiae]